MQLTDSHCHLDDKQFDPDRPAVIERAREAGVQQILAIGTGDGPPDLEAAIRIADAYAFVYATAGVHPNDAPKAGAETFRDLERLLTHPKVVAVGEIGLDYHWGVPKDVQLPVFVRQLEIAAERHLPVVIHTRDAWDDTLAVLREHWAPKNLGCVMHCFTGTVEQARECLDLGFHLAFGGVATFPKAGQVRDAARITPSGRLLLETDAPYLAPVPHRGKRNEPSFVRHTAEAIAAVRGVPIDQLATETSSTFERLFRIGQTAGTS